MTPDEHLPTGRPKRPGHPSPGQPASDDAVTTGSDLSDVEVGLRAALRDEAGRITPSNRLDAILAVGHAEASRPSRHRRWLLPVAAAAAAAVVVGGTLVVSNRQTPATPVAAGPTRSTSVSASPSGLPSTLPSATGPSSVPTQSAPAAATVPPPTVPPPTVVTRPSIPPTTTKAPSPPPSTPVPPPPSTPVPPPPAVSSQLLPVYYVATRQGNDVLFREFVTIEVTNPVTPTTRVEAAVSTAMGSAPDGSGYQARWKGVDLVGAEVTADGIRLELSNGLRGLGKPEAEVAVQQLVWTAQAAVGKGPLPVRFTLADGGSSLAPGQSAAGTYNRPTDPNAVFSLLSPLWIDSPTRGQVVPASHPVTVTGLASSNEANVPWQLIQDSTVVKSAAVTADQAAPAQGKFRISLGRLSPGDYVIRIYQESAKDGSVTAEQPMPFTVK